MLTGSCQSLQPLQQVLKYLLARKKQCFPDDCYRLKTLRGGDMLKITMMWSTDILEWWLVRFNRCNLQNWDHSVARLKSSPNILMPSSQVEKITCVLICFNSKIIGIEITASCKYLLNFPYRVEEPLNVVPHVNTCRNRSCVLGWLSGVIDL